MHSKHIHEEFTWNSCNGYDSQEKNINIKRKGTKKKHFNTVVHFQKPRSERKKINCKGKGKKKSVRGGIRTHAHIRGPECFELALASKEFILESGALDHSATLTAD